MGVGATQSRETEATLSGDAFLDIIKTYVSLDGNSDSPRGYCPLCHGDDRSFVVRPDQGEWHCFNCGQGGDVYKFIEKLRRVSHPDAMRFVEILSQSRASRIPSFNDGASLAKKSGYVRRASPKAKAEASGQTVEAAAPVVDDKSEAKDTRRTKSGAVDISLVAQKPPSPNAGEETPEVSSAAAESKPVPTAEKDIAGKADGVEASSSDPAVRSGGASATVVDKEKLVTDLLQKLVGQPGLFGLAVVARDDEGEMLGSSATQLQKKDVQIVDAFAKRVVQASREIIGDYDTGCMDVSFSMDAVFKAERTKLIWVPVGTAPCQCNVLLVLAEDARESVFIMKLKNFFK